MGRRRPKLHPGRRRHPPPAYDLRQHYRPPSCQECEDRRGRIENPYGQAARIVEAELDVTARLEPAVHRNGTIAEGAARRAASCASERYRKTSGREVFPATHMTGALPSLQIEGPAFALARAWVRRGDGV